MSWVNAIEPLTDTDPLRDVLALQNFSRLSKGNRHSIGFSVSHSRPDHSIPCKKIDPVSRRFRGIRRNPDPVEPDSGAGRDPGNGASRTGDRRAVR